MILNEKSDSRRPDPVEFIMRKKLLIINFLGTAHRFQKLCEANLCLKLIKRGRCLEIQYSTLFFFFIFNE